VDKFKTKENISIVTSAPPCFNSCGLMEAFKLN